MIYAISSESMRLSDEYTIKNCGVSEFELMDRAAHALFCAIKKCNPSNIAIVCGSGNNGGDGYCLALKLKENGFCVTVFGRIPKTQAAKYYYDKFISDFHQSFESIGNLSDLTTYDLVVDCLLGNGIKGDLSQEYVDIIEKINKANNILSCDIPSGLNSDNGRKSPIAVVANKTLAMQCYKTGHFLQDAKDCVGELNVCDIGINVLGEKYCVIDENFVRDNLPERKNNSQKGDFGRCGIVACSENFVGAGILANVAATSLLGESVMRVGAGYSYLFVPKIMMPAMWSRVTHSCLFSHEEICKHKLNSIAFGMGIGNNEKLFYEVLAHPATKVIDADAINILSKNMQEMSKFKGCVLTPHLIEFSRLTGVSALQISENPIKYAKAFAKQHSLVLLLKGCTTIVTDGEKVYLVTAGTSGQAKGGSGDVLSGVIAGLIAQDIQPLYAAAIGAFIAGKTAEEVEKNQSSYTMLPLDVAKEIGNILSKIISNKD